LGKKPEKVISQW